MRVEGMMRSVKDLKPDQMFSEKPEVEVSTRTDSKKLGNKHKKPLKRFLSGKFFKENELLQDKCTENRVSRHVKILRGNKHLNKSCYRLLKMI